MNREIKFEYGFSSINGIVKKVYYLHEIPNIKEKCDVWDVLPIEYVRQYTGLKDKNGKEIYVGDTVEICVFFVSPENTDNDIHFKGIIIYENFKLSLKIYKYMNDLKGWKNIDVDCFSFDLDYKEKDNTYIIPIYDLCSISGNLGIIQEENIEVIGNIYENSYLLK